MATDDCPLPDVAAALSPYIKTRDQVATIRHDLQNYLQTGLKSEETTLSTLNLTSPGIRTIEAPSASLSGVRKAYWKALQAHKQAQQKYEALRAELDQIKHGKGAVTSPEAASSSSPNDGYITLLRQREKHRKLKVIDRALSNISPSDSTSSTNNLDDIVKAKAGDAPTPPPNQPSMNRNPEVDAKLMALKKAIVATKRKGEEQRAHMSSHATNGIDSHSSQGEVAGLQKALQVLTIWMEDQLTLIASAEADAGPPKDDSTISGVHEEPQPTMVDIERLYEQYIEARQRLIETVNDETTSEPNTNGFSFDPEDSASRAFDSKSSAKSSAEILLPVMPALLAAKQEEQALVQQTSHTRKQMAAAEDELAAVIRRFAGESHLVQPGATKGQDWASAAAEVGANTDKVIKDRLVAGEQAATKAKTTLDLISSLPE